MSRASVIERAGKTIGIVIEDGDSFSFFASSARYIGLEGARFVSFRQLQQAISSVGRKARWSVAASGQPAGSRASPATAEH